MIFKKNMDKISIVIPYFNSSSTIKNTIDSVLKSKYKNYEIIIIDDGSEGEFDPCLLDDKRIFYYKKTHEGLGCARNYGIEKASGEYIFFLDADDLIYKNSLKHLYEFAVQNKLDVVSGLTIRNNLMDKKLTPWYRSIYSKKYVNTMSNRALLYKDTLSTNKLYSKNFFSKYNIFFEQGLFEDILFTAKLYENVDKIGVINEKVYMWLIYGNNQSITTTKNAENFLGRIISLEKTWDVVCGIRRLDILTSFINHHLLIYLREFINYKDHDKEIIFNASKKFFTSRIEYFYYRSISDPVLQRMIFSFLDNDYDAFLKCAMYISKEYYKKI